MAAGRSRAARAADARLDRDADLEVRGLHHRDVLRARRPAGRAGAHRGHPPDGGPRPREGAGPAGGRDRRLRGGRGAPAAFRHRSAGAARVAARAGGGRGAGHHGRGESRPTDDVGRRPGRRPRAGDPDRLQPERPHDQRPGRGDHRLLAAGDRRDTAGRRVRRHPGDPAAAPDGAGGPPDRGRRPRRPRQRPPYGRPHPAPGRGGDRGRGAGHDGLRAPAQAAGRAALHRRCRARAAHPADRSVGRRRTPAARPPLRAGPGPGPDDARPHRGPAGDLPARHPCRAGRP